MQDLEPALSSALAQHERALIRYAGRILGDPEQGRDIAQEAFLRLCRQDAAALNGRMGAWLFSVARNLALDALRKRKEIAVGDLPEVPGREPVPGEALGRREEASRMLKALARLPWNQQEALRLKFQAGLSYREISQATQLSISNVGFLIHTGLKTLRGECT